MVACIYINFGGLGRKSLQLKLVSFVEYMVGTCVSPY